LNKSIQKAIVDIYNQIKEIARIGSRSVLKYSTETPSKKMTEYKNKSIKTTPQDTESLKKSIQSRVERYKMIQKTRAYIILSCNSYSHLITTTHKKNKLVENDIKYGRCGREFCRKYPINKSSPIIGTCNFTIDLTVLDLKYLK
jgi:hypothetical protein